VFRVDPPEVGFLVELLPLRIRFIQFASFGLVYLYHAVCKGNKPIAGVHDLLNELSQVLWACDFVSDAEA